MEGGSGSGSGSGIGVPAPFLVKTYEMVDDSSTDKIVSWSPTNKSFIVWNPADFCRLLLPTYFKHSNFSSFIRQLNTYGFRKIHAERWEFANDNFVRDQDHLLKNIHRRKAVHSHIHPPQGTLLDPQRAALEEQTKQLWQEKTAIESCIISFKQNNSAVKLQLEDLERRLERVEERQNNLISFFEKALQNPNVVKKISRKIESMDYNKKRRLPQIDHLRLLPVAESENNFIDSPNGSKTEFGNVFDEDFSNKLKLELSPTVSDINLVSPSTRSSNEDGEGPYEMLLDEEPEGMLAELDLPLTPGTLEQLADTETPFNFEMDSCFSRRETGDGSPKLHSLELSSEECDNHMSSYAARSPQIDCQEIGKLAESTIFYAIDKESDGGASSNRNVANEVTNSVSSLHEVPSDNQANPAAPVRRVNDAFWEKFFTE